MHVLYKITIHLLIVNILSKVNSLNQLMNLTCFSLSHAIGGGKDFFVDDNRPHHFHISDMTVLWYLNKLLNS